MMQAIATSLAKPAALPWWKPPPICKATIKLVADATRAWHRTTHWLHHANVRKVVFTVMVVALRLERVVADAALPPSTAVTPDEPSSMPSGMASKLRAGQLTPAAATATGTAAIEADARTPHPLLPIEIWMHTLQFVKRSWWNVVPIYDCARNGD